MAVLSTITRLLVSGFAAVTVVVGASEARAAVMIALDDPSTAGVDVTLSDLDGDGFLLFSGAVGGFLLNTTGGLSKPLIGSPGTPQMDTLSITVSPGSGVLEVMVTDTDFTGVGLGVVGIGGTTTARVNYGVYWDEGNVPFARTNLIGSLLSFGPPIGVLSLPFAGSTKEAGVGLSTGYALTQWFRIVHSGSDSSSFNATVDVVPRIAEPATAALLGVGLSALALLRRKAGR